jgi:DNA-binding NarL/FixJ family response regulator
MPVNPSRGRTTVLTDRTAERDALDRLAEAVRAGASQVLVVRGEPGVGKSVLLDYLAGRATDAGCRVARAGGVQRELLATGETLRKRTAPAAGSGAGTVNEPLTAQEAQIARLAGDGLSNPEIGARLFISPRTVEWHLRKVFTKLGISSRRQLHRVQHHRVEAVGQEASL